MIEILIKVLKVGKMYFYIYLPSKIYNTSYVRITLPKNYMKVLQEPFFFSVFNIKVYSDKLPKALTMNYYSAPQRRCQEEQKIMTAPLHLT